MRLGLGLGLGKAGGTMSGVFGRPIFVLMLNGHALTLDGYVLTI
jgi:hypothetical protein